MIVSRDDDQRIFGGVNGRHVHGLWRSTEDGQVILVVGDAGQQLLPVADDQFRLDSGVVGAELPEETWQQVFGGGYHGEAKPPALQPLHVSQAHLQAIQPLDRFPAGGEHLAASIGEVNLLADALQKGVPDAFLKLLGLGKYRRLGQAQLFRRPRVGAVPSDGFEDTDLSQTQVH